MGVFLDRCIGRGSARALPHADSWPGCNLPGEVRGCPRVSARGLSVGFHRAIPVDQPGIRRHWRQRARHSRSHSYRRRALERGARPAHRGAAHRRKVHHCGLTVDRRGSQPHAPGAAIPQHGLIDPPSLPTARNWAVFLRLLVSLGII